MRYDLDIIDHSENRDGEHKLMRLVDVLDESELSLAKKALWVFWDKSEAQVFQSNGKDAVVIFRQREKWNPASWVLVAHELAHVLCKHHLPDNKRRVSKGPDGRDPELEKEANQKANEVLRRYLDRQLKQ
jgi:hypothetical protein